MRRLIVTGLRTRRQFLSLIVAIGFAIGIVVLIDVSRWPPLPRGALRGPALPPLPELPSIQPRPPAPPVAATPPTQPPSLPACTAGGTPSPQVPPGAAAPVPDPASPSFGPGRGYLEGEDPTFSADGREVVFGKDQEIWISSVDGRNLRRVAEGGHPAWAPDGSRIAFTFDRDIWVIDPDGSNRKRLTMDPGVDSEAAWSPDGAHIAFTSDRAGKSDIWIMQADGTDPRRVTAEPGVRSASSASFSPDGRRIVFRGNRGAAAIIERRSKLMIIDTDGGRLCQLTHDEFEDEDPAWSSRGIAFYSYRPAPDGSIWVVQSDGSGLVNIPETHGSDPAWSPDATRIAYGDGTKIEVFNLLDRTVRPLTQLNVVPLQIYVKPGSTNAIDPKADRSIPVGILSAPWFDPVRRIDQTSVRFGPPGKGRPPDSCAPTEVNKDGVLDLVCEFDVAEAFPSGQSEAVLKATGVDGILFEGRDTVRVAPAR